MKLYILRHFERDLDNPSFETQLLKTGITNAITKSEILKKIDINLIFSSPFVRCIQSVDFFSKTNNKIINIDYSLCEFLLENDKNKMSSIYNYTIPDNWYTNYNINKNYNKLLNIYNVNETLYDCIQRIEKIYNFLIKEYKNTNENILIITHMSIVNIFLHIKDQKKLKIDNYYKMGKITQII